MNKIAATIGAVLLSGGVLVGAWFWWSGVQREERLLRDVAAAVALSASESSRSDAAVALRAIVKEAPDLVAARTALADVCMSLHLYDEVIEHLDRAAALADPADLPAVQLARARAYAARYRGSAGDDDYKHAYGDFLAARSFPATSAEALHGMAMLHMEKGRNRDLGKALECLDELLRRHPDYADPDVKQLHDFLRERTASGG